MARRKWILKRRLWVIVSQLQVSDFLKSQNPNFRDLLSAIQVTQSQIFVGRWAVVSLGQYLHTIHRAGDNLVNIVQSLQRQELNFDIIEAAFAQRAQS